MIKSLKKISKNSRKAFEHKIDPVKKDNVLKKFLSLLIKNKNKILKENHKDIIFARKRKIKESMIKRLELNERKIFEITKSLSQIIKIKDPTDQILDKWKRPNGLIIQKVTVPIGIIAVIYESRPNVTADVASLCLKSGNCVILRGGSEAFNSNKILANLFRTSLTYHNIDPNCVQFIENKNRKIVNYLLSSMSQFLDVVVPRGGRGLVEKVQKFSKVHVIGHLEGLCHIYVDKSSNVNNAIKIILNAKLRRTSICGALETLLIEDKALKSHGIKIINALINSGCEVRVDSKINKIFKNKLKIAKERDWSTEYLDAKISIKSVRNVNEAVNHILKYGTMHTDSIITNNSNKAKIFLEGVNSSIAMHNVSTQFADGGEFGFGGEIGISTNKLPPRGPVGINQLTSYKYLVSGKGIIRP